MSNYLRWLGVVAVCFALGACAATTGGRNVSSSQLSQLVKPGDIVAIDTVSGKHLQFKVVKVDAKGLHGFGHDIAYADIRNIHLSAPAREGLELRAMHPTLTSGGLSSPYR